MTNLKKVTYSTDVDLFQSNLIVLDNNQCYFIDDNYDGTFIVYSFPLLDSADDWFSLDDINCYCDTNFSKDGEIDFIDLTFGVCSYYGAINLDDTPETMNTNEFEEFIETLQN
jgi:hypothetical protein